MNAIAIESSQNPLEIGVTIGKAITIRKADVWMNSSEKILGLLEEALQAANIELSAIQFVVVANGPGSFTGLRVANSVAKGLCLSLNIPLIAIGSLEAQLHSLLEIEEHPLALIHSKATMYYYASCLRKNIVSFTFDSIEKGILSLEELQKKFSKEITPSNISSIRSLVTMGEYFYQNKRFSSLMNQVPEYLIPYRIGNQDV